MGNVSFRHRGAIGRWSLASSHRNMSAFSPVFTAVFAPFAVIGLLLVLAWLASYTSLRRH
jgi:hypothetical protein